MTFHPQLPVVTVLTGRKVRNNKIKEETTSIVNVNFYSNKRRTKKKDRRGQNLLLSRAVSALVLLSSLSAAGGSLVTIQANSF
jgi:hypothetical protein